MDEFDSIWVALAANGHCDAHGGAEYRRVREAWFKFGYFNHLWQFIIASANAPPNIEKPTDGEKGGAA